MFSNLGVVYLPQDFFMALKITATILFISLALLFLTQSRVETVHAKTLVEVPTQETVIEAKTLDPRTVVLRDYLAKHNSPLKDHAQDFIEAADFYKLDWKLVTAIAGVESTFGKNTPGNQTYPSYNGWGWGVYGTQAIYFTSWKDGIYAVSKGLRENYLNKGLLTPYAINKAYAASPEWGWKVEFFIAEIEKFAQNYPDYNKPKQVKITPLQPYTALSSAKLITPTTRLALVP